VAWHLILKSSNRKYFQMKKYFAYYYTAIVLLLMSCNGGEQAGAGSDEPKLLKPNVEGISSDTSQTATHSSVDTSQAYSPTDTARNRDSSRKSMNK